MFSRLRRLDTAHAGNGINPVFVLREQRLTVIPLSHSFGHHPILTKSVTRSLAIAPLCTAHEWVGKRQDAANLQNELYGVTAANCSDDRRRRAGCRLLLPPLQCASRRTTSMSAMEHCHWTRDDACSSVDHRSARRSRTNWYVCTEQYRLRLLS